MITDLWKNQILHTSTLQSGIYAILDGGHYDQLYRLGERLLQMRIPILQIRAKSLSNDDRKKLAFHLYQKALTGHYAGAFIINDDIELARSLGTGVHVGQEDLGKTSFDEIQNRLGKNVPIGVSTHNLKQALAAADMGAHYIGFGPMFETSTKSDAHPLRSLQELTEVIRKSRLPVVAIGGITLDNYPHLLKTGARILTFLSALHDPRTTDAKLLQINQHLQDL